MANQGFIRKTKQRQVILDVLRSTKCHPTADWIYQEVKKEMPNVSLGTIYRNLRTLTEMGEALELSYGSSHSRFDGNPENHYHFQCQECKEVFDIDLAPKTSLETAVSEQLGADVSHHRLEFYGVCGNCK